MSNTVVTGTWMQDLRSFFGDKLQQNAPLAGYTTARAGGSADALVILNSAQSLEEAVRFLWKREIPFFILGNGSNILISDAGLRGLVIINRAKAYKFDSETTPPTVWVESGANLGGLARQAAILGLSGLEWAATVPGTIGGAVYGNAGAHNGDMQGSLVLAEILHPVYGKETWTNARLAYGYRTSILKRDTVKSVILSATLRLNESTREAVTSQMDTFTEQRRSTQPPGASMGSMFKNPPDDYAGRLIEAAGLKGTRIGGVEISSKHANFFINDDQATAADIWNLIQLVQRTVLDQFGVRLELEVEPLGEWPKASAPHTNH